MSILQNEMLRTFNTLLPELSDGAKYFHYLRMDVDLSEELYTLVEPVGSYRVGSVCTAFITFSLPNFTCSMLVLLAIFIRRKLRHKYVTHIISK